MQTITKIRKIIHIDMDCFFAAVEIRDRPELRSKPVAIGGSTSRRGVLSTCNYIARKYGLHSAMPTAQALKLCPNLVLLPGNMEKYKSISKRIKRIFSNYTPKVEMLSLDEGYLDVTDSTHCKGSATLIAQTIRRRIRKELGLTASAGVAPNKFLAKVASEWNKPNGIFIITPDMVNTFIPKLPVEKIYGVGKVTAQKLHSLHIDTCADLQSFCEFDLTTRFGKMGKRLYSMCRGIDDSEVISNRIAKSLSVEKTFAQDINNYNLAKQQIEKLIIELQRRLEKNSQRPIQQQFIKIKFADFSQTTASAKSTQLDPKIFYKLFADSKERQNLPIRLIGIGIRWR